MYVIIYNTKESTQEVTRFSNVPKDIDFQYVLSILSSRDRHMSRIDSLLQRCMI